MKIKLTIIISPPPPPESPASVAAPPPVRMERDPGLIYMTCDRCLWENGYDNMTSAKQGAASHRRWCRDGHGRKKNLFS